MVKVSVASIEREINKKYDGLMLLTDPQGVVFISSRADWLYQTLWKLPADALSGIAATRQFGSDPPVWTGMVRIDDGHAADRSGKRYMVHQVPISSDPGWTLVYLHDLGLGSQQIAGLNIRHFGALIILICLVVGLISIVLYRNANKEILERKRAEEELVAVRDRLQAVVKASPLPITAVDLEGKIVLWNPAAERVFGWTEQECLGQSPRIVPRDRMEEHLSIRGRIFDHDPSRIVESRRLRKDGSLIDVAISAARLCDAQGNGIAVLGIYEDITVRKKSEEEIRFFASIIQTLPEGVCAIDPSGIIIAWNIGAEKMLGYQAAEIIGRPITTVIPEEIAKQELEHCLTILNSEGHFTGYESIRLAKDGRRVPVTLTAVAIRDEAQAIKSYASIMVDITDRNRAEAERLKLHMLESIGYLAGGIAHDFNNLLTVITGNIYVAKLSLSTDDKAFSSLSDAENVCEIASELSRRLITFATGGEPVRRPASLSGMLTNTVMSMLKGSDLHAEFDLPKDLYRVSVDEGQMQQVFNNLIINAKEAMPKGGTLHVRGENIRVSAQDPYPVREGGYLKISIRDDGAGIPSENLAKIFDPYYSTKDTYSQKGLGLGLAVCYSVIKKHDGLITVESEVNKGTTYHIYLPALS